MVISNWIEEVVDNFKGVSIMGSLVDMSKLTQSSNSDQFIRGDSFRLLAEKRINALAERDGEEGVDTNPEVGCIEIEDAVQIDGKYVTGNLFFREGEDPVDTVQSMEYHETEYHPDCGSGSPGSSVNSFKVLKEFGSGVITLTEDRSSFPEQEFKLVPGDGFYDYTKNQQ
jgi:hypothetical protein